MTSNTTAIKSQAWTLYDRVVRDAMVTGSSPWSLGASEELRFTPDYHTLKLLLRIPAYLGSSSRTGVPALAIDVWVAHELRRAGLEPDSVWPRADIPRILPGPIARLLSGLNRKDADHLRALIASGDTFKGTVGASAKILGKNYIKQVDVVISDWDTGPELLISTKRMDESFGKNAPNRVEESYGDAKNLRSRHPLAALGFVFSLRSNAFDEARKVSDWIIDLLTKLGREDDAYDAVALIVPRYADAVATALGSTSDDTNETLIEIELEEAPAFEPLALHDSEASFLWDQLHAYPEVELQTDEVPYELSPDRFFQKMVLRVLDNSPITRHEDARALIKKARAARNISPPE